MKSIKILARSLFGLFNGFPKFRVVSLQGLFYMFLATISFAFVVIQAKLLSYELVPLHIVFWRSFFVSVFIFIFLRFPILPNGFLPFFFISPKFSGSSNRIKQRGFLSLLKEFHKLKDPILILRAVSGSLAHVFYIIAISRIPASEAALLCYSYPIFTSLLSVIFLKETWTFRWAGYLVLALLGLYFVTQNGGGWFTASSGKIFGVLTAFFAGIAITTIKKARDSYDPWLIVIALTGTSALISLPSILLDIQAIRHMSIKVVGFLFGIGTATLLGQFLMTYAYRFLPASTGSVISLFTVVHTAVLSVFLLGEIPSFIVLLGGVLIFVSSVGLTLEK